MNKLEIEWKFVFSPEVSLCGWLGSKHQLTNYVLQQSGKARGIKIDSMNGVQANPIPFQKRDCNY